MQVLVGIRSGYKILSKIWKLEATHNGLNRLSVKWLCEKWKKTLESSEIM